VQGKGGEEEGAVRKGHNWGGKGVYVNQLQMEGLIQGRQWGGTQLG